MFKNKYFCKNQKLNRKLIDGLNKLSRQSERMIELQHQLQQLKGKNKDESLEIRTNDQSQQTLLGKSQHEDFFDPKDQLAKLPELGDSSVGELCHFTIDKEQSDSSDSIALLNVESTNKISKLRKSKQLIEKQLLRQADFIQNSLRGQFSLKLKLLQIQLLIRGNLQEDCEKEPGLWQICSEILTQVFEDDSMQIEKTPHFEYELLKEPIQVHKKYDMTMLQNDLIPWLS